MKMSKKVREYKAGDFIFAKVKGYPAWPARVQRPNGKKYFVYFYGTGETANLPPNMIFDYAENKDKFLSKPVKRRDFNDGVKQIEYDFANNVPLEQVIGVPIEVPDESLNDTANDSAINDTIDDSTADTTAVADDTAAADESAVNTVAQNEPMVEDSDDAGALVIDEGLMKKGRKSTVKPAPPTPKTVKELKTARGKKKDDAEENKEDDKKEDEFVSRSGRKIRPKRYIDEQTAENATLPSPAPKKRRAGSPTGEREERGERTPLDGKSKSGKQLYTVTQTELEDLKEPFTSDEDKENILIAYLPQGQYVGIKLFQSRPNSFKNEPARLQWDRQQAQNAITLKQQLEKGQIKVQSVITQLVMDLNLTDEEKATLDKEREIEEKKSRVQFLKTEMKLIELEAKIKTCLCLEKADTDLCLKLLDDFTELEMKPLMLLKHPSCGETVKRLRAYVGNAPSWELSESAALLFAKQALRIRRRADALYRRVKGLFTVPEGLSFWEFFSERVEQFKKATAKLSADELLELVHEPLEMSVPTSHTMNASVEAANDEDSLENDDDRPKKKTTPKQKKPPNNSTPSKTGLKRQSSRKQQEKEKEKEKEQNSEQDKSEEASVEGAEKGEATENQNKDTESTVEDNASMEVDEVTDKTTNSNEETNSDEKQEENAKKDSTDDKSNSDKGDTENTVNQENPTDKDSKSKDSEPDKANKTKDDSQKPNKNKDESEKVNKSKDVTEKGNKSKDEPEKVNKNKNNSNKEKSKSKSPSPNEKDKDNNSKSSKESKNNDNAKSTKEDTADKTQKSKEEKAGKEDKAERAEEKDKEDEPRAKRSRESKKTDAPPPRSPTKRKSKF